MRKRSTLRHAATLATVLLHLGVVGLVPLADALLERILERDVRPHVEAEQNVPCSAGHDHLVCQLCRLAGTVLKGATPAAAPIPAHGLAALALPAEPSAAHGPTLLFGLRPRAPPQV